MACSGAFDTNLAHDGLGTAFGRQGQFGFEPGSASTGHIERRITLHFQIWCGPCGASTGTADDVVVGVWVQLFDAHGQLFHRHVDGARDVSGVEFVGFAHIQYVGVVGDVVDAKCFKITHGAHRKPGKRPAASKSHRFLSMGV